MVGLGFFMNASSQCFKIWAHDPLDTADARVMEQLSRCRASEFAAELEGLYCNIQTNFVAEFETVDDGLFRTVDFDRYPIDHVLFNPLGERFAGIPENTQRRIIESWLFHGSGQRNRDFVRDFSCDLVKKDFCRIVQLFARIVLPPISPDNVF